MPRLTLGLPGVKNFAASTALPQPPNTSQNVPSNSAAARFAIGTVDITLSPLSVTVCLCPANVSCWQAGKVYPFPPANDTGLCRCYNHKMETVADGSVSKLAVNILSLVPLIAAVVWTYLDAKAIGDEHGQMPGLVNTQPAKWAIGVFLLLIVVFPVYLFMRVRFKRLAAERKMQAFEAHHAETQGEVWPPPPDIPAP